MTVSVAERCSTGIRMANGSDPKLPPRDTPVVTRDGGTGIIGDGSQDYITSPNPIPVPPIRIPAPPPEEKVINN